MPIPVKAVIFDYGNVLSEAQKDTEIRGMAAVFDLPVSDFEKAYWLFRVAYDEANLEPREYWSDTPAHEVNQKSPICRKTHGRAMPLNRFGLSVFLSHQQDSTSTMPVTIRRKTQSERKPLRLWHRANLSPRVPV